MDITINKAYSYNILYKKDNEGTRLINHGSYIESSSLHLLNLIFKLWVMTFKFNIISDKLVNPMSSWPKNVDIKIQNVKFYFQGLRVLQIFIFLLKEIGEGKKCNGTFWDFPRGDLSFKARLLYWKLYLIKLRKRVILARF